VSCCDYNKCTQGDNCPVRSTPTPGACIQARHCLSQTGDCHCDALAEADAPLSPLSLLDRAFLVAVVICAVLACGYGAIWLGKAGAGWVTTVVQAIPVLPVLPTF
jgi:hypothetical protein